MILPARNVATRRKNRRISLASLEPLEGRQLMTAAPAVPQFATVDLSQHNWQYTQIPASQLAPMEETTVTGIMPPTMSNGTTVYGDNFEVYLSKGQIDDISLAVSSVYQYSSPSLSYTLPIAHSDSVISVYDPSGNQVTGVAKQDADSEVDFQAATSGWYYVSMHTDANSAGPSMKLVGTPRYAAQVRPIGLDATPDSQLDPNHKAADAAKLDFDGGALYAVLNGRAAANSPGGVSHTGTSVSFVGPTGRGFTIDGNWTEATDPNTWGITYTGSNLTLEMVDPTNPRNILKVPLSIGSATGLQVVMAPQTANDSQGLFGQVLDTQFTVGNTPFPSQVGSNASIAGAISTLAGQFGESADLSGLGVGLSASNNLDWGIDLGDIASAQADGMPANSAVPYIWFSGNVGDQASASFGKVSASVGSALGLSAMLDPADPSFRLDLTGLPIVSDLGLGASINGLIPYAPNDTNLPADKALGGSTLYGDLYLRGDLDLSGLTDGEVPVDLSGDITLNLDPGHHGLGTVTSVLRQGFEDLLTGNGSGGKQSSLTPADLNNFMDDLEHISLGVNGTVNVGEDLMAINFSAPVAQASVLWDGMNQYLALAGGSVNPLAGTPLSFLTSSDSLELDGSVNLKTKDFGFDLQGSFGALGQTLAAADVNVAGNYGSGSVTFNLTGSSDIGTSFGSMSTVGFDGDVSDQITIAIDSSGNATLTAQGLAEVTAGFAGHTKSASSAYSYQTSGNIKAEGESIAGMFSGLLTDATNSINSLGSSLEGQLESTYSGAVSSVQAAWNKFKSYFS